MLNWILKLFGSHKHSWTKWKVSDHYKKSSYSWQERECETCGRIVVESI